MTPRRVMTIVFCAILALTLEGCNERRAAGTAEASGAPIKRYTLRGVIIQLNPKIPSAVIKHSAIEGWMEAMTMEFPVKDRQEYAKLHEGDKITATVFVQDLDYWIGEIKPQTSAP